MTLVVEITWATISIKKGLTNSIGWKRKIYKFNHLLAPLTSVPKKGTNNNNNKKNIKNTIIKYIIEKMTV